MVPFNDVLPADLAKLDMSTYIGDVDRLRKTTPTLEGKSLFNILVAQKEDNEAAKFIVSTPFILNDPSILIPAQTFEELFLAIVTTRYGTSVQRDIPTSDAAVDERWFCHLCAIQFTELLTDRMTKEVVNIVFPKLISNYVSLHEQTLIVLEASDEPKQDYYLFMETAQDAVEGNLYPITLYREPHRVPQRSPSPSPTLSQLYKPLNPTLSSSYPTFYK